MVKLNKRKILSENTKVDKKVVENYKTLRKGKGESNVMPNEYRAARLIEESGIQHYDNQK